jgi:3-hydroxyisobutyrate dehydrogenase-like beta-hydroxyacid dehydrogenase
VKLGFIGLGTMGRHMARHLVEAGHDVTVHDLRREAADEHLALGAVWSDSIAGVAEGAAAVFTSLPGPPEVEAVVLGAGGLFAAMAPDSAYFDLSTNSPTVLRGIGERFAERGVHTFDAPVSGGPRGAASKKLAIWLGGDAAIYPRYEPVLRDFSDQPVLVGPIGAGSVAKLVHNCAGYVVQTALAEVMTLGVKAGVDPLELWKAVRQGAIGRRRTFEGLADQFLPGEYEPAAFALRLAHKDVSLACALGREKGVPMRLANLTLEEMTEAMGRGWAGLDSRSSMRLQQERAGVEISVERAALRAVLDEERAGR